MHKPERFVGNSPFFAIRDQKGSPIIPPPPLISLELLPAALAALALCVAPVE
jgi:hypothetical protein